MGRTGGSSSNSRDGSECFSRAQAPRRYSSTSAAGFYPAVNGGCWAWRSIPSSRRIDVSTWTTPAGQMARRSSPNTGYRRVILTWQTPPKTFCSRFHSLTRTIMAAWWSSDLTASSISEWVTGVRATIRRTAPRTSKNCLARYFESMSITLELRRHRIRSSAGPDAMKSSLTVCEIHGAFRSTGSPASFMWVMSGRTCGKRSTL